MDMKKDNLTLVVKNEIEGHVNVYLKMTPFFTKEVRDNIKTALIKAENTGIVSKKILPWKYRINYNPLEKQSLCKAERLANEISIIYEEAQL